MARRATIIREQEALAEEMFLLDSGPALLHHDHHPRGQTNVEVMDTLGYDALAMTSPDMAVLGLERLRDRQSDASFPFLSANVFIEHTSDLAFEPYTLLEMRGHTIAIIGLTEEGKGEATGFKIVRPEGPAREWVEFLRPRADVIILLSHAGQATDRRIAKAVPGIDLIVMGGSFVLDRPEVVEGTTTVMMHADRYISGSGGQNVGVGKLTISAEGVIIDHEWERIELSERVDDNAEMANWLMERGTE